MNDNKVMINNKQFLSLVVCLTWPTTINICGGFLARRVGHDMWLSGIIGVLITLPFIFMAVYIGRNFPDKTVVEYSQELLGKFLGKLLGIALALYFFAYAILTIVLYLHHLTDFLLPETPFLVVIIMHIIVICYFIWHGPEVIGRISTVAFFLACIFMILVFLASITEFDINRLFPLFDKGVAAVVKASPIASSFVGKIQIVTLMLLPMITNQKKAFRSATSGLLIGGAFFVFYFIAELMVMGPQLVALMRIASMDFVRSIQITEYLHRFESFMVGLWYWSMLVQSGVMAFCALKAFTQTVGIKQPKPYQILLFSILMAVSTYFFGINRVFFLNFREFEWDNIMLPLEFGLPVILLLLVLIKKGLSAKKC